MGCESDADPILYTLRDGERFVFLVVYVDDIVLILNKHSGIDYIVAKFSNTFEIWVSKTIERFLGLSIEDDGHVVKLHNKPMVESVG